jgi:aryl-alcohol dehydrogenase-like predicted oxidoreductase
MEYRNLGRSGLQMSVVGLGCNNFGGRLDQDASSAVVKAALDRGITHFDTADIYSAGQSETILGRALKGVRDEVVIGTKFGNPMGDGRYDRGGSRRYVRRAVEASLRRLGTEYIDIYYLHRPDPLTPIEETLSVLNDLVHEGKVRYLAASSMPGWQLVRAAHVAGSHGWDRFEATQDEWSLLSRAIEGEVVPACEAYEIGVIPYFPLASGLLTGKYREGEDFPPGSRFAQAEYFAQTATPERFRAVRALQRSADEIGRSLVDVALGWLTSRSTVVSVPVGASTPAQVVGNVDSATPLSPDEQRVVAAALDRIDAGEGVDG